MIEFSNVSKVYPNGVVGLDDVNLTIEQGEFVGIIGLSGAGKSTLLRTINRMHDITSGTLTVDGQEVKNLKGKQLRKFRRNIGMIFQTFNLFLNKDVLHNVMEPLVTARKMNKEEAREEHEMVEKTVSPLYDSPHCNKNDHQNPNRSGDRLAMG